MACLYIFYIYVFILGTRFEHYLTEKDSEDGMGHREEEEERKEEEEG